MDLTLVSVGLSVLCAIVVVVRSFTRAEVKADDVTRLSAQIADHEKRLIEIEKQIALSMQASARTDQDYLDLKEQITELRDDVKGLGDKIVALTYALKGTKSASPKDSS